MAKVITPCGARDQQLYVAESAAHLMCVCMYVHIFLSIYTHLHHLKDQKHHLDLNARLRNSRVAALSEGNLTLLQDA